jgi:hypothetical protein
MSFFNVVPPPSAWARLNDQGNADDTPKVPPKSWTSGRRCDRQYVPSGIFFDGEATFRPIASSI